MSDYVTRIHFEIDGQEIPGFKGFEENEVELSRAVPLINDTGFTDVTPRYGFSVDYAIPAAGDEYDFAAVRNSVVTVALDGGRRYLFSGVRCLNLGSLAFDGEKEAVRRITFGATGRRVE